MKKNIMYKSLQIPISILFLSVFTIGCHTPEDLREIGPQQEMSQEEWTPDMDMNPVLSNPDITADPVLGGSTEVGEFNLKWTPIKTPVIPSRRSRTGTCRGC